MEPHLKVFGWKLLKLLLVTPIAGYAMLICAEDLVKVWKTKGRARKWLVFCIFFLGLGLLFGWLD